VPKVDEAAVNCTGVVRRGAVVVGMLSTKAPMASLPQGTLLDSMTRRVLMAPKAVWEDDVISSTSLPKYSAVFHTIFSFFDVRWALGGENVWDPITTGRKKECGGGRRTCSEEVLLEVSANCTGSKSLLYRK